MRKDDQTEDPVDPVGQPQVVEDFCCPYQDPLEATKPCPYKNRSDIMIGAHERAVHIKKDMVNKTYKDEGSKEDTKKSKRIESNITKFPESETHYEF